jgi:hypothetical protein
MRVSPLKKKASPELIQERCANEHLHPSEWESAFHNEKHSR